MYIKKEGSSGISMIPIDSQLFAERKLFINGVIDDAMADEFMKMRLILAGDSGKEPIKIYINSPGGEVQAGFSIYDVIKSYGSNCTTICYGTAASMAALLFAAAPWGQRIILPHAKVLIHEPYLRGGPGGSAADIQTTAEQVLEDRRRYIGMLANDTGKKLQEIETAMSHEHFMNADEAVAFKICDRVASSIE